jgi:hypothetical protein
MPSDKPVGPTVETSGPSVAPVSLSARQAKEQGLLTSGTYGRRNSIFSASDVLRRSLVSKLKARLVSTGSTLFKLTWKEKVTPAGRSLSLLRASAHRTGGSASTSLESAWPTPTTPSGGQTVPEGTSATGKRPDGSKATVTLANVAALAWWPSADRPALSEHCRTGSCCFNPNECDGNDCWLLRRGEPYVGPWPTARASDGDKNVRTRGGDEGDRAEGQSAGSGPSGDAGHWTSPQAHDSRGGSVKRSEHPRRRNLADQAFLAWP